MNIPAIYNLKVKDWDRETFNEYKIKCEVVGESDKMYKIRLLQPTHNRRTGDLLWVYKHNIKFTGPDKDKKPLSSMDYDDFEEPWWNKI